MWRARVSSYSYILFSPARERAAKGGFQRWGCNPLSSPSTFRSFSLFLSLALSIGQRMPSDRIMLRASIFFWDNLMKNILKEITDLKSRCNCEFKNLPPIWRTQCSLPTCDLVSRVFQLDLDTCVMVGHWSGGALCFGGRPRRKRWIQRYCIAFWSSPYCVCVWFSSPSPIQRGREIETMHSDTHTCPPKK